jgi:hypothetical protein
LECKALDSSGGSEDHRGKVAEHMHIKVIERMFAVEEDIDTAESVV